jgi:hypothetical protein
MPHLIANNITIPREVQNDCDPGDRAAVSNATALQGRFQHQSSKDKVRSTNPRPADTAAYIGKVCEKKNCSAFLSVGDNFYDSGVDFTTGGIIRFQEAWVDMYRGGVFDSATWYQCLGNHDVVKGQSGVDFETKVAPLYDSRWYFGTTGQPYYTYDLTRRRLDRDVRSRRLRLLYREVPGQHIRLPELLHNAMPRRAGHAGCFPGAGLRGLQGRMEIPPAPPRVHVRSDERH